MKLLATVLFFFLFLTGAFSQTRNVLVNTSSVVVQPTNFWSADVTNARSGLGLGSAATNPASAFQPSSAVLSNLASSNGVNLTNLGATNIIGTVSSASNVTGMVAINNGGTAATNAAGARTNLGLGWSALTNSNAATSLLGYTTNGEVVANMGVTFTNSIAVSSLTVSNQINCNSGILSFYYVGSGNATLKAYSLHLEDDQDTGKTAQIFNVNLTADRAYFLPDASGTIALTNSLGSWALTTNASTARTNLGLGWSALTNSNSGTELVSVNSNGSVVSPTNFWQQAPIQTLVQTFVPVTNSTNAGTNARNLYVYSLATNISGVTNVITLPTNTATFVGDNATVIHRGTTSSVTAVRQAGQSTNLIVISNYDDAIAFIHENGTWDFYHNISFVEPIKFTDVNLEFNKATSRTNLGIPLAALTNTNNASFQRAVFQTNTTPASAANLSDVKAWLEISSVTNNVTNSFRIPLFQ